MINPLLIAMFAFAADDPPEVRELITDGVVVNWTQMRVEATASARRSGVGSQQRAVEQTVRREIGRAILQGVQSVRVTEALTVGDLELDVALGETIRDRVALWGVVDGTYYASGRVALQGALSLQELLRPWILRERTIDPPEAKPLSDHTGVVIDTLGLGVRPAFSLTLTDDEGQVLYDGAMYPDVAVDRLPVVYVHTPAHPVSARAGDHPWMIRAVASRPGALILADDDAVRLRESPDLSDLLRSGTLVVIVE